MARSGVVEFDDRQVLYSWIGGTRNDWRGQGHFRALSEEQEAWAVAAGFDEIVVKTKNRFYGMRATLTNLQYDVVKYEPHPADNLESKVYLSKRLGPTCSTHRSARTRLEDGRREASAMPRDVDARPASRTAASHRARTAGQARALDEDVRSRAGPRRHAGRDARPLPREDHDLPLGIGVRHGRPMQGHVLHSRVMLPIATASRRLPVRRRLRAGTPDQAGARRAAGWRRSPTTAPGRRTTP